MNWLLFLGPVFLLWKSALGVAAWQAQCNALRIEAARLLWLGDWPNRPRTWRLIGREA